MAKVGIVTWAGGGNVAVAVGLGTALAERGHDVLVLGPSSLRSAILDPGLGYRELGAPPPRDPAGRGEYLRQVAGATSLSGELDQAMADIVPEVMVIDCNLSWALRWAQQVPTGMRTAVLVHTALGLYLPVWQAVLDAVNDQRKAAGHAILDSARQAWSRTDLLLVASLRYFDRPPPGLAATYVGPVLSRPSEGYPTAPTKRDDWPTVVVSYSTDALQNQPGRMQTALDAFAELPVRVLASTSGLYPASQLSVPDNAAVSEYLPLASALAGSALMVCHAGHGTTMAALTSGVPLVCVPGLGRDQAPIAARVAELGLGIALEADATGGEIAAAANIVLTDPIYRSSARRFARRGSHVDGAASGATAVEKLLHQHC